MGSNEIKVNFVVLQSQLSLTSLYGPCKKLVTSIYRRQAERNIKTLCEVGEMDYFDYPLGRYTWSLRESQAINPQYL